MMVALPTMTVAKGSVGIDMLHSTETMLNLVIQDALKLIFGCATHFMTLCCWSVIIYYIKGNIFHLNSSCMVLPSPLKNRTWKRSSWTFNWNCCIKNSEGNMWTWALNKQYHFVPYSLLSVAGILQFPFVRYFTWISWIFRSVSVSVDGNQTALGSV